MIRIISILAQSTIHADSGYASRASYNNIGLISTGSNNIFSGVVGYESR